MKVLGIDLAGSPKRDTGVCLLSGWKILDWAVVHTDEEILDFVRRSEPDLIAVDAPLNLPPGRKTIEDRNGEHYRICDLELRKRKIPFFPITLGPMRMLTLRGIYLKKKWRGLGFETIEIYPGAAQDIWKIARKQKGLGRLRRGLEKLGVKGLKVSMNGDVLDAVTAAIVGKLHLQGKAEVLGNFRHGAIVVPRLKVKASSKT